MLRPAGPPNQTRIARGSPRVSANVPMTMTLHPRRKGISHTVLVLDVSMQGARVRFAGGLLAGQIGELASNEGSSKSYPFRVVWVSRPNASLCVEAGLELGAAWPSQVLTQPPLGHA
jgi:hypothetical protein